MSEAWIPPRWLTEIEADPHRRQTRSLRMVDKVRIGDLYIATPMDGYGECRVVLVLNVGVGWADIALTHTEPEMATDSDLTIAAGQSPTGYPLVIQFDVRAPLFFCQIENLLATLDVESTNLNDLSSVASSIDARRGMPIRSRQDPRRAHKSSELRSLQALARPCVEQVLDGPREDDFDPELILAAHHGSKEAVRWLIDAAQRRERKTSVVAEMLIRDGALAADEAAPESLELMNALAGFLMPSGPRRRRYRRTTFVESLHAGRVTERALAAVAESTANAGSSCVFLASGERFWPGQVRSEKCGTLTADVGERRVQLVGVFPEVEAGTRREVVA